MGSPRWRPAAFLLLCVFTFQLFGCATGAGTRQEEQEQSQRQGEQKQPQKEMKRPAATNAKPSKKQRPSEEFSLPPKPIKPPAIGGSGG